MPKNKADRIEELISLLPANAIQSLLDENEKTDLTDFTNAELDALIGQIDKIHDETKVEIVIKDENGNTTEESQTTIKEILDDDKIITATIDYVDDCKGRVIRNWQYKGKPAIKWIKLDSPHKAELHIGNNRLTVNKEQITDKFYQSEFEKVNIRYA